MSKEELLVDILVKVSSTLCRYLDIEEPSEDEIRMYATYDSTDDDPM